MLSLRVCLLAKLCQPPNKVWNFSLTISFTQPEHEVIDSLLVVRIFPQRLLGVPDGKVKLAGLQVK